ncbi:MAG: DNA polymerase IV [Pseudomonadota bacterium]
MILHVDMDAFFAAVEQRDDPALKGKCVIVGGTSGRGVVSAASYEARRFGVHSAMPVFQARQRCPHGVFVHPRMGRYKEVSAEVMAIFHRYSPLVEPVSVDEAYLDVSGCGRLLGAPVDIAARIKAAVHAETALTCSIGIAPCKFLAKIASDMNKPDGLTHILPETIPEFIDALDIRKVPGVGAATEPVLRQLGIHRLGDVRRIPEALLERHLGQYGRRLRQLAEGDDGSPVVPSTPAKSVSSETTLQKDTADAGILRRHMLQQSETVARQLRRGGVKACTVQIKMKDAAFHQITRRTTLAAPTQSGRAIYGAACALLERHPPQGKLRLIGVGAAGLTTESRPRQASLFDAGACTDGDWEKADTVMDRIADKFGRDAIRRAALVEREEDDG